jgi:hypothetical protein
MSRDIHSIKMYPFLYQLILTFCLLFTVCSSDVTVIPKEKNPDTTLTVAVDADEKVKETKVSDVIPSNNETSSNEPHFFISDGNLTCIIMRLKGKVSWIEDDTYRRIKTFTIGPDTSVQGTCNENGSFTAYFQVSNNLSLVFQWVALNHSQRVAEYKRNHFFDFPSEKDETRYVLEKVAMRYANGKNSRETPLPMDWRRLGFVKVNTKLECDNWHALNAGKVSLHIESMTVQINTENHLTFSDEKTVCVPYRSPLFIMFIVFLVCIGGILFLVLIGLLANKSVSRRNSTAPFIRRDHEPPAYPLI